MTKYYPLVICRSDGVSMYMNGTVETANTPRPAELDARPKNGLVSVYKQVPPNEPKDLQWRHKEHILKAFPENYVLWQQLKYQHNPNDPTNTSAVTGKKTHAAGGAERNDAYLFGHPGGRSKKYRSPQEFFPHLLWLATDLEGNQENCSCKHCSPEKRSVADEDDNDDSLGKTNASRKISNPPLMDPANKTTTNPTSTSRVISAPMATLKTTPTAYSFKPSQEQEFDGRANGVFIYRPGELVWFNKDTRWGLAVVCRRQVKNDQPEYLLQPLSNPLQQVTTQVRRHDKLRPWLAWSVPEPTFSQLRGLTFDQVPWDRVVRGEFREAGSHGDAEVDGSILAAKGVDGAYSLFDRLNIPSVADETHYNGMFLGGEKVWTGEPVRLKSQSEEEVHVLVIEQLVEKVVGQNSALTLVGDVYKFVTMPSPYNDRKEWPTQKLPARMVADLRFRNEVADNAGSRKWSEWQLVQTMSRKSLPEIRGRWYEFRSLFSTLVGETKANEDIRQGKISEASYSMNSRMTHNKGLAIRKRSRLDTLGASVPKDTKISKGLNGPLEENVFGPEQPVYPGMAEAPPTQIDDVSQFMDLDGEADELDWNAGAL